MRKTIIFAALAAALVLVSCQKNEIPQTPSQEPEISFNLSVDRNGFDTKGVKTGWENGDKVYVFFDSHYDSADDLLVMTYNGGSWTSVPGANIASQLQASGTLFAVYATETPTITYGGNVKFLGTATGTCGFFTASGVAYTYAGGEVTANITLGLKEDFLTTQITVTGLTGSGWYIQEVSGSSLLSFKGVSGNNFTWSGVESGDWGGKHYLADFGGGEMRTHLFVSYYTRGARNWSFLLSNGTVTYKKTFSSKTLDMGTAAKFAGPDDPDNPTNGWVKLLPGEFSIQGTISAEDF